MMQNHYLNKPDNDRQKRLAICLLLVLATLFAFWQVRNHDFVSFDDSQYLTDNPYIREGLQFGGIRSRTSM